MKRPNTFPFGQEIRSQTRYNQTRSGLRVRSVLFVFVDSHLSTLLLPRLHVSTDGYYQKQSSGEADMDANALKQLSRAELQKLAKVRVSGIGRCAFTVVDVD